MTSVELKQQIDTDITDKTATGSVTPTNVGDNMKDVVDYVDQEVESLDADKAPKASPTFTGTVTAAALVVNGNATVPTVSDSDDSTKIATTQWVNNSVGKQYVAYLSQTGTSNPTQAIMKNTLGSVSWERDSVGVYRGSASGSVFATNTTFINPNQICIKSGGSGEIYNVTVEFETNSSILVSTFGNDGVTPEDAVLDNFPICVTVYGT